jgi:hypothetical protein
MQQRWYDRDPTLSMAISLLQNASHDHQEMAARYMFKVMEGLNLLNSPEISTKDERIRFIFPSIRRNKFELHARHLVELIKHLSPDAQEAMAVQLINYIYILDCGLIDLPMPTEEFSEFLAQPETG